MPNINDIVDVVVGDDTSSTQNTNTEDIVDNSGSGHDSNSSGGNSVSDLLHEIGNSIISKIR